MASTIVQRTINAVTDLTIDMPNSSWGRPIVLPSTWSKVRFGMRMHCVGNVAVTGLNAAFGFCSGTTALPGDFNTTNFVGMGYNAVSGGGAGQIDAFFQPMTKVGTTTTFGANLLHGFLPQNVANTFDTELLFVDITKGSPNYSINIFGPTTNGGVNPATAADFLTQVVQATPAFGFHSYSAAGTIAASEVAGAFNAVTAWWGSALTVFEITDHAVVLLA